MIACRSAQLLVISASQIKIIQINVRYMYNTVYVQYSISMYNTVYVQIDVSIKLDNCQLFDISFWSKWFYSR